MILSLEEREHLTDEVVKMLVDYDTYVIDKHRALIEMAEQMTSSTPFLIKPKPDAIPLHYWKYQTDPMIHRMTNIIVSFIINKGN